MSQRASPSRFGIWSSPTVAGCRDIRVDLVRLVEEAAVGGRIRRRSLVDVPFLHDEGCRYAKRPKLLLQRLQLVANGLQRRGDTPVKRREIPALFFGMIRVRLIIRSDVDWR